MSFGELTFLGYIKKNHGYNGGLKVLLEHQDIKFNKKGSLILEINQRKIPFFITDISVSNQTALLYLEDIITVQQAEELIGCKVFGESKFYPKQEDDFEVIGFDVIDDVLGHIGKVIDYIEKAGQDILVIDYQSIEAYIPYTEDFIYDYDETKKIFYTNLPEGILDINK